MTDSALQVVVPACSISLPGELSTPAGADAAVIFAHGSGSSRHSSRNKYVAGVLQEAGLATLLFDLLDEEEARDRRNVFDIELLAERVLAAVRWMEGRPETAPMAVGLFGASTGAGAALAAAAQWPSVRAVVSRGGRPDLAGPWLSQVRAPTLLIVGEADVDVLALNRQALARLSAEKELAIVPRATHLFEEPGTLEAAAQLARDWFVRHLRG